jgi:hypothetical protein
MELSVGVRLENRSPAYPYVHAMAERVINDGFGICSSCGAYDEAQSRGRAQDRTLVCGTAHVSIAANSVVLTSTERRKVACMGPKKATSFTELFICLAPDTFPKDQDMGTTPLFHGRDGFSTQATSPR